MPPLWGRRRERLQEVWHLRCPFVAVISIVPLPFVSVCLYLRRAVPRMTHRGCANPTRGALTGCQS